MTIFSKFGGRIGPQMNLVVDSPKSSFHLPTENGTPPKSTMNGGPSCSVPPIPGTIIVSWWQLDCPSIILSFMHVYHCIVYHVKLLYKIF